MANTKLTLTVDDKTIMKAKEYAREHKTSVSSLFSRLMETLVAKDTDELLIPRNSVLSKVSGIAKNTENKTDDELLYEALAEKYELE